MEKKSKENNELSTVLSPSGLLSEKISRRTFGKLLGAQTLLASAASAVTLSGCGGGGGGEDDAPAVVDSGTKALTRAEFVATVSNYFGWVHSSEYNDEAKAVQRTFIDVIVGTTAYAKQIETALEESLISNASGYFSPETLMTREDAADIYVKAFKIPTTATNALAGFTDAGSISAGKKASVNAIVAAGYMKGTSSTLFAPAGNISGNDAKTILTAITAGMVTPVQVMPKSGTTSYRRYVNFTTPTAGATIYYTYTTDGKEPADPTTASTKYDPNDGYFLAQGSATADNVIYKIKAIAVKNGLLTSPVQLFTYFIYRPIVANSPFQATLVHAATSTSPAVWNIWNPSDTYRPHVYYIEGSTSGIVFDAGEHPASAHNLKTFIDKVATKPYVALLGHNNPDHVEQVDSFVQAGIKLYMTPQDQISVAASSRADFKDAAAKAIIVNDGYVFNLGNVSLTLYQTPGHSDGLCMLQDKANGWIFASDMYGCNRPATADITNYSGVKVDLFLSLCYQLKAQLKANGGRITEVYNAHNEVPVGEVCTENFEKCFQQIIDSGDSVTIPSLRSVGTVGAYQQRTSMVGDMWRNKDWMAIWCGGTWGKAVDYFSKPTNAWSPNIPFDYNLTDAYKKYSVLSNIEIGGGTLVGVTVTWNVPLNGVPRTLSNRFDPWTYSYTINVPAATTSITIKPRAMSNNVKSMKVNGTAVTQGSSTTVAVSAGSKIVIDITAPDGSTTSSYIFTVAKV
jgi:glyoxylase-like metal-dependent hydrolase (beta-lactamase superfamily II)